MIEGSALQRTVADAATSMGDLLGTMLGPWGTYTLVADTEHGDPVVTMDPIRALRPLSLSHPVERLLYGLACDQRDAHGDGALSATLLCGAVLARCGDLIAERGLHPRTVDRGLAAASEAVRAAVEAASSGFEADPADPAFRSIAHTQAATWFPDKSDHVVDLLTDVVEILLRDARPSDAGGLSVAVNDRVHVFAHEGGARADSRLFDGVLVETEVLNDGPASVSDATVATVDQALYLETGGEDETSGFTATVDTPADLTAHREAEDAVHRRLVEPLLQANVDVLVARKGIDDRVSNALRSEGVLVVRRAKPESILESVAAATGATVVGDVRDLSPSDLGTAPVVESVSLGPLSYTRVGAAPDASAASVLVRAGTWLGTEAAAQSVECALAGTASALREQRWVAGGGATAIAVAQHLRDRAPAVGDRTALVFEAVADAMDALVGTLARNCGLDRTAVLPAMHAGVDGGVPSQGVVADDSGCRVGDVVEAGVLDPVAVRRGAFTAALGSARHAVTVDQLFVPE